MKSKLWQFYCRSVLKIRKKYHTSLSNSKMWLRIMDRVKWIIILGHVFCANKNWPFTPSGDLKPLVINLGGDSISSRVTSLIFQTYEQYYVNNSAKYWGFPFKINLLFVCYEENTAIRNIHSYKFVAWTIVDETRMWTDEELFKLDQSPHVTSLNFECGRSQ